MTIGSISSIHLFFLVKVQVLKNLMDLTTALVNPGRIGKLVGLGRSWGLPLCHGGSG